MEDVSVLRCAAPIHGSVMNVGHPTSQQVEYPSEENELSRECIHLSDAGEMGGEEGGNAGGRSMGIEEKLFYNRTRTRFFAHSA